MSQDFLFIDREYIRMETLKGGINLAVLKVDYDRIVFLMEVYGSALSIPEKEVVGVVALVEKKDSVFELGTASPYLVPMRDLKLTVNKDTIPDKE
jgi:hypothetical protein